MKSPHRTLSLLVALAAASGLAAPAAADDGSAYFRVGDDEIEWRSWSPEVFQEAQRLGLPVLLNMGTFWDHTSRAMAATYGDPAVTAAVTDNFIPLKIDADRDPHLRIRVDQAMNQIVGAFPLLVTAVLSAEGRMFVGASYFLPADRGENAGLETWAKHVSRQYQEQPRYLNNTAEEIGNLLVQAGMSDGASGPIEPIPAYAVKSIAHYADSRWGGLGESGKQVRYPTWLFVLDEARVGNDAMRAALDATLTGMANGAIHDRLAGGFHYATDDRTWQVPAFAKHLTVNAGLLELYAQAYASFGEERDREVAAGIVRFLMGELADRKRGGMYTAVAAAELGAARGSAYTWTLDEIDGALDDQELALAKAYWGLSDRARTIAGAPGANTLAVRLDATSAGEVAGVEPKAVPDKMRAVRAALAKARAKRGRPPVDETMYTAANGIAAHALLVAGQALDDEAARAQALAILDRFLASAWDDEAGFARGLADGEPIGTGLLQDQVHMAYALITAYEATGRAEYLDGAVAALDLAEKRHRDPTHAALFDIPLAVRQDYAMLIIPHRPVRDWVEPGTNAAYALALDRVGRILSDDARLARAREVIAGFGGSVNDVNGTAYATLARAALRLSEPPPSVTIVAPAGTSRGAALARVAAAAETPGVTVSRVGAWSEIPPRMRDKVDASGIAAIVFEGDEVRGWASEPEELAKLLAPTAKRKAAATKRSAAAGKDEAAAQTAPSKSDD